MSNYLDHLENVAADDVAGLKKAEQSYGDSWKKRGGVGAFMMLARKWDRIENRVKEPPVLTATSNLNVPMDVGDRWDIFAHIAADPRAEGLIDDIRDLRRYLLLVEAEMCATGAVSALSIHRDNAS